MEIVTEQYKKKTYNGEGEAKIYNCSGLNNCSKEFLQKSTSPIISCFCTQTMMKITTK